MHALKLIPIDGGVGVVLPKEVLAKLQRGVGETIFLCETPDGLLISAQHPAVQQQVAAGRKFLHDYQDAVRLLAE